MKVRDVVELEPDADSAHPGAREVPARIEGVRRSSVIEQRLNCPGVRKFRTPVQTCYRRVMAHDGDKAGLADLAEALSGLDLDVEQGRSGAGDLVVHLPGQDVAIVVEVRKAPSPAGVLQLMESGASDTTYRLLVVDHLSASVREVLDQHGWGYFDRGRGRLRLWAGPLRVDALIDGLSQGRRRPREALATAVGREVAVCLLIGDEPQSVRRIASQIDRAPSSVSTALQALRVESLVEPGTTLPLVPELFWALAGVWGPSVRAVGLRECPAPGDAARTAQLGLGLEGDVERSTGWALRGDLAAAGWGARVVVGGTAVADFFVPDSRVVRICRQLYGEASTPEGRRATVAVAPMQLAVARRFDLARRGVDIEWPVVHPLFVALDLAQGGARGREILDEFEVPDGFRRVW